MTPDLTIKVALITTAGALGGALIGAIVTLLITWMSKRSEERNQYRQLLIHAAIENYKEERELGKRIWEKTPGQKVNFYPLDVFIIHMYKLGDLVLSKKLKPEELNQALQELDKYGDQVESHFRARHQ